MKIIDNMIMLGKIEGLTISIKHIKEESEFIINCNEGLDSYSDAYYSLMDMITYLKRQRDHMVNILKQKDLFDKELERILNQ